MLGGYKCNTESEDTIRSIAHTSIEALVPNPNLSRNSVENPTLNWVEAWATEPNLNPILCLFFMSMHII